MLTSILERIDKLNVKHHVDILAVTKTRSIEEIQFVIDQGISLIGENRIQEAQNKLPFLSRKIEKHLIGSLQSNKENKALELFDVIQSIESLPQLKRIIAKIEMNNLSTRLFLQCNTSLEDSKHGVKSEYELYSMVEELLQHPKIHFEGLMTIGAMSTSELLVRKSFAQLSCIKDKIILKYPKISLLKLSMGMSQDFEWAIQEGADLIRLGTILFHK